MENKPWDILLIDDEIDLLLVIGNFLRGHKLTVLTAQDSTHALKQLDENQVGLIVLDVNLAGEDGLQLMPFIKRNYPTLPIVLYTGLEHDDVQVKKMLANGATCYVNKGQPPAALLFAIREIRGEPTKPL
jgi:DNA-binding response OmpR family regulator